VPYIEGMATKLMIATVYDAFRQAGVEDGLARAASEDIAGYDNRLNAIERKIDAVDAKIDRVETKLDGLDKRSNLMFGVTVALFLGVIGLLLRLNVG
jgi:hypothetical protein